MEGYDSLIYSLTHSLTAHLAHSIANGTAKEHGISWIDKCHTGTFRVEEVRWRDVSG